MKTVRIALDWIFRIAGGILFFIVGANVIEYFLFRDLSPPSSIQSVSEFREWRPDLDNAIEIRMDGVTYYSIKGPPARMFPSTGWSDFIFDSSGNYIGRNKERKGVLRTTMFYDRMMEMETRRISADEIPVPAN